MLLLVLVLFIVLIVICLLFTVCCSCFCDHNNCIYLFIMFHVYLLFNFSAFICCSISERAMVVIFCMKQSKSILVILQQMCWMKQSNTVAEAQQVHISNRILRHHPWGSVFTSSPVRLRDWEEVALMSFSWVIWAEFKFKPIFLLWINKQVWITRPKSRLRC